MCTVTAFEQKMEKHLNIHVNTYLFLYRISLQEQNETGKNCQMEWGCNLTN